MQQQSSSMFKCWWNLSADVSIAGVCLYFDIKKMTHFQLLDSWPLKVLRWCLWNLSFGMKMVHSLPDTLQSFTWTVKCGSPLEKQSTCAALLKKSSPVVLLEPELWYENGTLPATYLQSFLLNCQMRQLCRKPSLLVQQCWRISLLWCYWSLSFGMKMVHALTPW